MTRVLYVDDDPTMRKVVAERLEAEGTFDVTVRADPQTALEDGLDGFDCVLSDDEMPGMDGVAFLDAVQDVAPSLPFVLCTTAGNPTVASEAITAGATDVFRKSGEPDQYVVLAHRIERAVETVRGDDATAGAGHSPRESHERLGDPLVSLDEDWRYTYVNAAAEDFLGVTEDEILGERVQDVFPEVRETEFEELLGEAMDTGERATTSAWYDSLGMRLKVRVYPTDDDLSVYFHEATAEENEQRFLAQVVDEVGVGVAVYGADGHFQRVNEAFAALLGVEKEQLEGMGVWEVNPELDEEWFDAYWDSFEEGETRVREATHHRADGTTVPVETVTTCRTLGDRAYHFGTVRDISERTERERKLERQNEYLDEFASIVSHDLRNPLNAAQLYLDLLDRECDSEYVADVEASLDRMERIVVETLALARSGQQIGDIERVSLERVVEECWGTVETADARLAVEGSVVIRADRERFRHLLENLLQNAIVHGGEDVTVRVGTTDDGIYVADDGEGLPDIDAEKLFESSYSGEADGTGLGLAIVERIAQAHGWEVTVGESEDGGARFEIGDCR